jgi:serine/threonine protein kinase
MIDVMDALRYLHERKVLHRDIKCDNVLLRKDITALLSDFGLSTLLSSDRQEACSSMIGTAIFMAPELSFDVKYSYPADIYSFGIMCMELLSACTPGSRRIGLNKLQAIRPGLPKELYAIVRDCTMELSSARPRAEHVLPRLQELLGALRLTPADTFTSQQSPTKKQSCLVSD